MRLYAEFCEVDYELLCAIMKYFCKENLFILLNFLAGKDIKFCSVKEMEEIENNIKIYNDIDSKLKCGEKLEDIIVSLTNKYNLNSLIILNRYNEVKNIIEGVEDGFK